MSNGTCLFTAWQPACLSALVPAYLPACPTAYLHAHQLFTSPMEFFDLIDFRHSFCVLFPIFLFQSDYLFFVVVYRSYIVRKVSDLLPDSFIPEYLTENE